MNERIKQLFLHAFPPSLNDSTLVNQSAEKFAQLIVEEATSKIESIGWKSSNDIPFEITDLFVKQIKQHFGVEE